jgi:hypothetical protein
VSFSSLLGLSQSTIPYQFDFLPQYLKTRKEGLEKKRQYLDFSIIGLEVLFILAILLSLYNIDKYFYRTFLDSKLSGMQMEVREIDKVMGRLRILDKEFFKGVTASQALSVIISSLPANAQLVFLELQENGEVTFKGFANNIADVFSIVGAINGSEFFSDVEIKYASQTKRKNKTAIEFYIEGKRKIK